MAETPRHYFRIDNTLFKPAEKKRDRLGIPLTSVVVKAIEDFIAESDEESMAKYGGRLAEARVQS
jgi:hypothetical protein